MIEERRERSVEVRLLLLCLLRSDGKTIEESFTLRTYG